ncbi:MAG TPA: AgmX/PglI C-terminal domain-containing protein [Gammaproteobacteria bacterium]|jgi:TonB family protein|nr:AgmX/PglI C-terminal domain-containing protein [Gammaproteobacteria bacterium]
MANAAAVLYRIYDLPWSTGVDDDRKFKQLARGSLVAAVVLAFLLWLLPQPKIDPQHVPEVPRTLVKLVLERQQPPPPPPQPVVRDEPKPEKPVEERKIEPPKPKPEPVVKPEPKPVDTTAQARERAKVAGLLPLTNALQSLRDNKATEHLDKADVVGAVNGSAPFSERSLITSKVGTASGGINTAALSRNTGGSGLAARNTTQVESPVEAVAMAGGAAQRSGDSNKASRSREEIERVFDANKGRIFTLYNRALRENPALQGKVVLKLTITPDGRVQSCEVVSSELHDPELEKGLVQRVLQFQFEPRDVETITTTKPIDFFPA